MRMATYRTSMQIVADLLTATEQGGQEGIKTTSLLTKANLSHSRLSKFIDNLTGAGLINKIEFERCQDSPPYPGLMNSWV